MTHFTSIPRTVYFARPIGKIEPIKIGCSKRVERRLQQLRWVARSELELLAAIPGSLDDERRIQSLFWHDRIEGEWFSWSRGLQILIDAAARGELEIDALPVTRILRKPEISAAKAAAKARKLAANA